MGGNYFNDFVFWYVRTPQSRHFSFESLKGGEKERLNSRREITGREILNAL